MTVQLSYSSEPAAAVAGMLADTGDHDVLSGMASSRKLVSVAVVAANSVHYIITINGVAFDYTSDGSATTAEIVLGLKALINAGSEPVLASGSDTPLLIESTLDDGDFTYSDFAGGGSLTETVLVAQGEQIPFGHGVVLDERALTDIDLDADYAIRLPRQATDITSARHFGITLQDQAREVRASDSATFRANTMTPCLSKGRCWVKVEQAVVRGDDLYVRYAAGGNGLGACGNSAGSSERAAWPRGRYLTNASANGLALVELNG